MKLTQLTVKFSVLGAFLLAGCAMEPVKDHRGDESFDRELCSQQQGYERGQTDGNSGKTMDSRFAVNCRDDLRSQAQTGYQQGYQAGLAQFRERRARDGVSPYGNAPTPSSPPSDSSNTSININIGNQYENGGTRTAPPEMPRQPRHECAIQVYNDHLVAEGDSEVDAARGVTALCEKRHRRDQCKVLNCRLLN